MVLDLVLASAGVALATLSVFAPLARKCGRVKVDLGFPKPSVLSVPWDLMTVLSMSVASVGLWLCLFLSLWRNGPEVTHTHCRVPNVLGSISTCIGDFNPQRSVWKVTVMLYLPQRVLATWPLAAVYESWTRGRRSTSNLARAAVHLAEQFALGLLTAVSSSEHLLVHEVAFGTFALASVVNMYLTCSLLGTAVGAAGKGDAGGRREGGGGGSSGGSSSVGRDKGWGDRVSKQRSFTWRRACSLAAAGSLAVALYFFYAHNAYCISYGYSLFALFEWLFVAANSEFGRWSVWSLPCLRSAANGLTLASDSLSLSLSFSLSLSLSLSR